VTIPNIGVKALDDSADVVSAHHDGHLNQNDDCL
jgi:hypothetical protein